MVSTAGKESWYDNDWDDVLSFQSPNKKDRYQSRGTSKESRGVSSKVKVHQVQSAQVKGTSSQSRQVKRKSKARQVEAKHAKSRHVKSSQVEARQGEVRLVKWNKVEASQKHIKVHQVKSTKVEAP